MAGPFIPSGRTSTVKKRNEVYQLQTEYARLPHPRVTTSVSVEGRVLHKIEKALETDVDSIERMHEVEDIIKAQHLEVSRIVRETEAPDSHAAAPIAGKIRSEEVRRLEEVERVYLVTADGDLVGDRQTTAQFKKLFKHLLKELPELLNVFSELPGPARRREGGIYEVEAGRIYLASTGAEFYLILVRPGTVFAHIEGKLKRILFPE